MSQFELKMIKSLCVIINGHRHRCGIWGRQEEIFFNCSLTNPFLLINKVSFKYFLMHALNILPSLLQALRSAAYINSAAPHMSSPQAKGNPWDKVILVWEKHIELTAPFGCMWVMTEHVPGLSGWAEQKIFWHKHRGEVLMEVCCEPVWPPVFWGWPQVLLCWSDFVLSLLCYWLWVWIWQTDLKVSYPGSFSLCFLACNPAVKEEMLLLFSPAEASGDTEKLHSL